MNHLQYFNHFILYFNHFNYHRNNMNHRIQKNLFVNFNVSFIRLYRLTNDNFLSKV